MGATSYSDDLLRSKRAHYTATGRSAMGYTDNDLKDVPRHLRTAHATLDPVNVKVNSDGIKVREARDSDAHPKSRPIAVFFDVTGSMHSIPRVLQEKLPKLMSLLLRKGYVDDPAILFGAIGDARVGDKAPLQVGQFESGIEMDDNLEHFYLEGGGGGNNMHESYELAMYFMARHVQTDSWEKRTTPGYLFIIGDEMPLPEVTKADVQKVIGAGIEANIKTEDILAEVQERWEVFFIDVESNAYGSNRAKVTKRWKELLPERVISIAGDDAGLICETIAAAIGACEGITTIDADLADAGTSADDVAKVKNALVPVSANLVAKGGVSGDLATSDGGRGVAAV